MVCYSGSYTYAVFYSHSNNSSTRRPTIETTPSHYNYSSSLTTPTITYAPKENWTLCYYFNGNLLNCSKQTYISLALCQVSGDTTTLYGNTYLCGKNCNLNLYCASFCNEYGICK